MEGRKSVNQWWCQQLLARWWGACLLGGSVIVGNLGGNGPVPPHTHAHMYLGTAPRQLTYLAGQQAREQAYARTEAC